MIMWSRNTVRESSHISFFWCIAPFYEVVRRPEYTLGGANMFAWVTSRFSLRLRDHWPSPLDLSDEWISAFSPKMQTLYCLSSPMRKYEYPLCLTYFWFIAGYRNLHSSVFFSGNLLILSGNRNICYYIHRQ